MGIIELAIVSLFISCSVVYLVTHLPITKWSFGIPWSPRLFVCKFLVPADIILTITLIVGPMFFGISGIMAFLAGGFTAAGLSVGVFFIKKIMVPIWERKFADESNSQFTIVGEQAC